jgi:dihydroorotate dehydrogenase
MRIYPTFFNIFFKGMDPEKAHHVGFWGVQTLRNVGITRALRKYFQPAPELATTVMGITFPSPFGLAAGFDKGGKGIAALAGIGFGHVEIGTITGQAQPGNPQPRLFRLVEDKAVINRMGFNNHGVDHLVENVKKAHFDGILGINIGKNKDTPVEQGKDDYLICMEKVYAYAGYIAVNISSPNTPGLRSLQYGEALDDLLSAIKNKQNELQAIHHKYVPVAVKIAPDLSAEELIQVADSLVRHNIDGVIATNTTLDRSLVQGMKNCDEAGGLSGRPVQLKSTEIIRALSAELNGRLPIIGVGGIDSVIAAREKMAAGASLVQIYSGFIFKGPPLIKEIVTHI